jgi:hypothetical protein
MDVEEMQQQTIEVIQHLHHEGEAPGNTDVVSRLH